MFESALHTLRPRRRASVILSTSLHAALMSALVFPPMLRMPELAEEPPDNMPKFVDVFTKPEVERPKAPVLPRAARPSFERANKGSGGPAPNVRVVVAPTVIGDLPKPLAPGQKSDVVERIGTIPYEPERTGTEMGGDDGDGDLPPIGEGPVNANARGVTAPVPVSTPPPVYPEVMLMAHLGGTVILEAVIDREGNVRDARVLRGVNPLLDQAATEAVLKWRYSAARIDEHPVAVYLTVTVNFRIVR